MMMIRFIHDDDDDNDGEDEDEDASTDHSNICIGSVVVTHHKPPL